MLQSITGHARRAIDDYNMIEDGDKIAIGISNTLVKNSKLHVILSFLK